jgi:undecaprenyl diphosphate synthase
MTSPLTHLAVAPDGNGRWAMRRGLSRSRGHEAGARPLLETASTCIELGIPYLTYQIFTTENWGRQPSEVEGFFGALDRLLPYFGDRTDALGARVNWVGRRDRVPAAVRDKIEAIEQATAGHQALTISCCLDYGSHQELTQAVEAAARDLAAGVLTDIDTATVASRLQTAGLPPVDLFIRTSGEQRLSNFLLWQCAYAELVFFDELWPDFTQDHLRSAVAHYRTRHRRFGRARYTEDRRTDQERDPVPGFEAAVGEVVEAAWAVPGASAAPEASQAPEAQR